MREGGKGGGKVKGGRGRGERWREGVEEGGGGGGEEGWKQENHLQYQRGGTEENQGMVWWGGSMSISIRGILHWSGPVKWLFCFFFLCVDFISDVVDELFGHYGTNATCSSTGELVIKQGLYLG